MSALGTTTTITGDSPDPSVVGQAIAVSFTVTGAAPTPTGNVTVTDGVATCVGALDASATGSCNLIPTTAGVKTLHRDLCGGCHPRWADASMGILHTVNAASTTTTITGDTPDPSTVNTAYTVAFTVTAAAPGTGTPTGNVTVSDGAATCTATVAVGTCSLTSTTTGAKTLTATYAGDGNFLTSSGTTAHTVSGAATTTQLAADTPDPQRGTGKALLVSFTVTGAAPTPTGNVTVPDGVATCTGALTAGAAAATSLPRPPAPRRSPRPTREMPRTVGVPRRGWRTRSTLRRPRRPSPGKRRIRAWWARGTR